MKKSTPYKIRLEFRTLHEMFMIIASILMKLVFIVGIIDSYKVACQRKIRISVRFNKKECNLYVAFGHID